MKKLPPSGYTTADASSRPGYLAAKFRRIEQERKARAKEAEQVVTVLTARKARG